MLSIGIDPGINGAVVILNKNKCLDYFVLPTISTTKRAKTKKEIDCNKLYELLIQYKGKSNIAVEKVHAIRNQGIVSSFSFGYTYGNIYAIANLIDNNIISVTPQKWQNKLKEIYFTDKITKAFQIYNYDKIAKTIKDTELKEYFNHIVNLKSSKPTKIETLYLYYLMDNKLQINYKNDNIVDAYCIAKYISTTLE